MPSGRLHPNDDDAALLARLPTAEEIARQIRHRPIGAVIADICRDLGITGNHALWRELRDTVIRHGGDFARLTGDTIKRVCSIHLFPHGTSTPPPAPIPGLLRAPELPPPTGTGPPQPQGA